MAISSKCKNILHTIITPLINKIKGAVPVDENYYNSRQYPDYYYVEPGKDGEVLTIVKSGKEAIEETRARSVGVRGYDVYANTTWGDEKALSDWISVHWAEEVIKDG